MVIMADNFSPIVSVFALSSHSLLEAVLGVP